MTLELQVTAAQLAALHHQHPSIQRLGSVPLAKATDVEVFLDLVSRILYPGFFDKPEVDAETAQKANLIHLMSLAAQLDKLGVATNSTESWRFFEALPAIAAELVEDLEAAFMGDPSTEDRQEIIHSYPGFKAITCHRLAHALFKLGVPLLPRLMAEISHSRTGIDIHPGASIGARFFIDHGTGVVIGETCVIGANVKIYQGVTLGALSFARDADGNLVRHVKRHPTIEDNVVIYANATILGGHTVIGHDSVIGSSVWLNQSIAPFTVVTLEKPLLRYRGQHDNGTADFQI